MKSKIISTLIAIIVLLISETCFSAIYLFDSFEYSNWSEMANSGWTFVSLDGSTTSMLTPITSPVTDGAKAILFDGDYKGVIDVIVDSGNLTNVEATIKIYHDSTNYYDAYDSQFSLYSNNGKCVTMRCYGTDRKLYYSIDGGEYVNSGEKFKTGWNDMHVAYDGGGAAYLIFNGKLVLVQTSMVGLHNIKIGRNWSVDTTINAVFDNLVVQTSTVHPISQRAISDHSDASTTGSIAWCFSTYGNKQYYVLTSNLTYTISDSLYIPEYSTLTQRYETTKIKANIECDNKAMIYHNNWAMLRDLDLDANNEANHCVYALGKTGSKIHNCQMHDTKNDFELPSGRCHIVFFDACANFCIDNCYLYNAGYPKANNEEIEKCEFYGGGIYALDSNGTTHNIRWNTIEYVLAAGIDITGSVNMNIYANHTLFTGMNAEYDCKKKADSK